MFSLRSFGVMGAVEKGLLEMQIGTPKETAKKVLTLSSDSSSLGDSEASQNDPATPPAGAAAASLAPIFMPKSAASSRLPSTKVNHKKHEVKKPKKLSQKLKNPKKNLRTLSQFRSSSFCQTSLDLLPLPIKLRMRSKFSGWFIM